ncbi:MAG: NAD(P)-dependent oxidoreductase, partial [Candidatus Contubernalis sp.]|nr:NAD(P)-dependent oxidoreductase [Candidatus Contubernalis sp.]
MEGFYPINIKVKERKVLIVGGGEVAFRKVKNLLSFGARILVVSPGVLPEIESMAGEGLIKLFQVKYNSTYLEGCCLVIGATDDRKVN